jgi:hypothetical protein
MKHVIQIIIIFILVIAVHGNITDQREFEDFLKNANRVVIRTGGLDYRYDKHKEKTLLSSSDHSEVKRIVKIFHIISFKEQLEQSGKESILFGNCLCTGSHSIEFYKDTHLILTFSVHHDAHIRSPQINKGFDTNLTPESQTQWKKLISSLGIK